MWHGQKAFLGLTGDHLKYHHHLPRESAGSRPSTTFVLYAQEGVPHSLQAQKAFLGISLVVHVDASPGLEPRSQGHAEHRGRLLDHRALAVNHPFFVGSTLRLPLVLA